MITGKSWSWIKARCSAIKESSNAIVYGVPFRKNILHFAHKMMRHHLVFVDMKNFFFQHQLFSCLHETIFHATSTRFCWHQITFCATSNLLFQHKITFRAQSRVFFRHFEIRKKKISKAYSKAVARKYSVKKKFLKNFVKLTEKSLCRSF